MLPSHDIFKIDSGGVLWRGAVESFEAAKARIQTLGLLSPGEYLIFDQITGHEVRVVMGISIRATAAGVLTMATA